jgi:hypothetical protein
MATIPNIPGEVIIDIPFSFGDGLIHSSLTLDQYNFIKKYVIAHQKQLNTSAISMAKKKNFQGQIRAKLRYNLVLGNNNS